MSKKADTTKMQFNTLLGESPEKPKRGRPRIAERHTDRPSTKIGCRPGESKMTVIARDEIIEQFRDVTYWMRERIIDTTERAFSMVIEEYIKEHGELKPRPPKKKLSLPKRKTAGER